MSACEEKLKKISKNIVQHRSKLNEFANNSEKGLESIAKALCTLFSNDYLCSVAEPLQELYIRIDNLYSKLHDDKDEGAEAAAAVGGGGGGGGGGTVMHEG